MTTREDILSLANVRDGQVHVIVIGLTGTGKSAVAGEIEIALRAIGIPVEWTDGESEKRMTHADWASAIEMYKPRVLIHERNISRAAPTPPAAEAPGQEPVAVKRLTWSQKPPPSYDAEPFVFWAAGIGGHYRADPDGTLWLSHDPFVWQTHASQKEAKAAAQADYEQRIRSVTVSAPPTYADAEAKKSDRQIVDEINDLARTMLRFHSTGYEAPAGHKFYAAQDTRSRKAWQGAVEVYEQITGTEVHDALLCLDDDPAIRSLASPAPKGAT